MESYTEDVFCLSSDSSDEDMLFSSDTEEERSCGDETVVTNAVHTPPAISSDEDVLFPSDMEEEKQCGDETVLTNAVRTPPAMIAPTRICYSLLKPKRRSNVVMKQL